MLEFKVIYTDRFVRKMVSSNDGRCLGRTMFASNAREYTFASKQTGIDIYLETLHLPEKAYDVFNPYDNDRNNLYSFRNYKDAVQYAFGTEFNKEIIEFMEKEDYKCVEGIIVEGN